MDIKKIKIGYTQGIFIAVVLLFVVFISFFISLRIVKNDELEAYHKKVVSHLDSTSTQLIQEVVLTNNQKVIYQTIELINSANQNIIYLLTTADRQNIEEWNNKWDKIEKLLIYLETQTENYNEEVKSLVTSLINKAENCNIDQRTIYKAWDLDVLSPDWNEILKLNLASTKQGADDLDVAFEKLKKGIPEKYEDTPIHGYSMFIWMTIILTAITVAIYILLSTYIKVTIKALAFQVYTLSKGDLPSQLALRTKELRGIVNGLNFLTKSLKDVKKFAEEVGEGNFETEMKVFSEKGSLGRSLAKMRTSLKNVADEDSKREKVSVGLERFSEILGNYTNDLEQFGDEVISGMVKFLGANQGAMFVVNDEVKGDEYLELSSCFAYDKKKYVGKKLKKGQGLAGQAWQEGKRVYLTQVPENYINITSGLGYSTPKCVLIIPLKFNDEIHGIIEVASFKEFEQYELDFVEKAAESIASALSSVKVNARTQKLLRESEELTQQMRAQEEEMRQNMEELQATQEEMQRKDDERVKEIHELRKKLEEEA